VLKKEDEIFEGIVFKMSKRETEKYEESYLYRLRHTTAHVMADAVQRLFPEAKVTIGPPVEDGFYYDFDYPKGFSTSDLENIESMMKKIIDQKLPLQRREISRQEAQKLFEKKNEPYKLELLNAIGSDETLTLYTHGSWEDLCRGPHVEHTGEIKAFKLLKVAGSYWRGDEKKKQLQRIYGTAFSTKEELEDYLRKREEAEKRDHRRLGKELDLFSTMGDLGAGLILWHPKGGRVRQAIEDFWREEHRKGGYELLFTPHIARLDLWKTSGHWEFYRDNMYTPMLVDDVEYELKPMNCPFHIQIYKTSLRSYRDLPFRWAELGTVYRHERSGVLHGLMRVRGFTQDDAHLFCRPDQLEEEITTTLAFCLHILRSFGFTVFDVYLSTKPEKHVGSDEAWTMATKALENALNASDLHYEVDPGEGVFYGPKIDIKIQDSLGRAWQCSTIQVDFNLPERYELEFVGNDGEKHRPIMIHRALMGSLERFFGVLIEHYAGAFPVWLAPVQARIVTISDEQREFASSIQTALVNRGFRIELDDRNEKLGLKIREAEMQKIPYMLVIGKKEQEAGLVAIRSRNYGDMGKKSVQEFTDHLFAEVSEKKTHQH